MSNNLFQIRVTGLLIENEQILLVKQSLADGRQWSLPGGRLEHGETLAEGLIREMREETGLDVRIGRLVYLCEQPAVPACSLLHITFLVERTGGNLHLPTNEHDQNPISDVRMVCIEQLPAYGFSQLFTDLAKRGFPDAGSYRGGKSNIGL